MALDRCGAVLGAVDGYRANDAETGRLFAALLAPFGNEVAIFIFFLQDDVIKFGASL